MFHCLRPRTPNPSLAHCTVYVYTVYVRYSLFTQGRGDGGRVGPERRGKGHTGSHRWVENNNMTECTVHKKLAISSLNSDNSCPNVPLQVNFLDDDIFHCLLSSMSLTTLWILVLTSLCDAPGWPGTVWVWASLWVHFCQKLEMDRSPLWPAYLWKYNATVNIFPTNLFKAQGQFSLEIFNSAKYSSR